MTRNDLITIKKLKERLHITTSVSLIEFMSLALVWILSNIFQQNIPVYWKTLRNFADMKPWTLEEAQSFEIIGTRKSFKLHDNKIVLLV